MTHEHPTTPDYAKAYARLYPLARLAVGATCSLRVDGTEHIPDTPAIYASNHNTVADPLWLAIGYYGHTRQPLRFLAKKEYFDNGGIDGNGKFGRLTRSIVTATGQIPVDRESGRNDGSIAAAITALDDDETSIGIFPEGTLSMRGQLGKLHAGIARIALRAEGDIPIVPIALLPEGKHLGRPAMRITFGQPIDVSHYRAGVQKAVPEYIKARRITDTLEEQLAALTGYTRTGKIGRPGEVRRRQAAEKAAKR